MAERRMFSKKITESARFIKMPTDTQALYFHLGIRADDDGIVEAFTVMRLVGATEDSLKLLAAKNFVRVLNDDLVTHITDWNEHNLIRADRKVDSIYKGLLLEVVPEIELVEPKQRADRSGTSQGQPKDCIGKGRVGKDKLVEYKFSFSLKQSMQYDSLSQEYRTNLHNYILNKNSLLAEHFYNHHRSKGSKYKNWSLAFNTWCLNDAKFNPKQNDSKNWEMPVQ